ncbi:class I mannose-6-phosphate isomerase [candidate division KSB1 bacterium]|nr:class I mannose-6-phosphate isomerase [candidate division KSB1 bacterium]
MNIPNIILLPPNRVWRTYSGGKFLDVLTNKPDPADSHFPEDWIASTTRASNKGRENIPDEGFSKVNIEGRLYYLKELIEKYPDELVGEKHFQRYGANTQFLLKFLDAAIRLHIQAHPTIPFAQKYLHSNSGKTEAYLILRTREEVEQPYIYLGFQHPVPKEQFKNIILNQQIPELLACFDKIPVQPGDVFVVPGGLPHAIGEGIFMIEIMEPTDFVVRLEFERGGYVLPESARFMGRDIDFALEMMDFNPVSIDTIKANYFCYPKLVEQQANNFEYALIGPEKTPCFAVNKLEIQSNFIKKVNSFYVGIVTDGKGTIKSGTERTKIQFGEKFFIPFKTKEIEFVADEKLTVILAFSPQ